MNRKSLISGFLSLLIFAQCAVPSMAAEDTGDLSLLDEAVSYMKEEKVLYGNADGNLNLDRPLTYGELAVFLCRIQDRDVRKYGDQYPWYYGALVELEQEGNFPEGLTSELHGGDNVVYNRFALKIILPYFGIYPYPMSLYPGVSYDIPGTEKDEMAWNAALLIGLIQEDLDPMAPVTRGNLIEWMYRLETGDYQPLVCPENHPILKSIKDETNWEARNGFIESLDYIPEKYLDDFVDNGWSLVFNTNSHLFDNYPTAVGLTVYSNQTIAVRANSIYTNCHEFGHYIAYRTGIESYLSAFYNLEADEAKKVLGSYPMTNDHEYFAGFFGKYLSSPESSEKLKQLAPYTWTLIDQGLIHANGLVNMDVVQDLYHQVLAVSH